MTADTCLKFGDFPILPGAEVSRDLDMLRHHCSECETFLEGKF